MTHNEFIKCKYCTNIMNIRIQLVDKLIPFHTQCPECGVSISGYFHNELVLNEKHEVINSEMDSKRHCIEISSEFPTRKMWERNAGFNKSELQPFLKYVGKDDEMEILHETMLGRQLIEENFNVIKNYYEIYWSGNIHYLFKDINSELENVGLDTLIPIDSDFKAMQGLHHLFMLKTGLSKLVGPAEFEKYSDIQTLLNDESKMKSIIYFLNEENLDMKKMEIQAVDLLTNFVKQISHIMPAILIKNTNSSDKYNRDNFGITTVNYNELKDFYTKSYEWMLENINVVVALNNIFERGFYKKCVNDKKFSQLEKEGKYSRLEYLVEDEKFTSSLKQLNNRIRNSIQHYDDNLDYISQEITFTNKFKGTVRVEKIQLLDFALLCVDNFRYIMTFIIIIHNLKRLQLTDKMSLDEILNFYANTVQHEEQKTKIGRNEKCPCGSGLKYKKCCIK